MVAFICFGRLFKGKIINVYHNEKGEWFREAEFKDLKPEDQKELLRTTFKTIPWFIEEEE